MKTKLYTSLLFVVFVINTYANSNSHNGHATLNNSPTSDSLALVAFYNATNGANWSNPWNLNQPMDTWYGVTLNSDRRIDRLTYFSITDNLVGNIPPEIGNLSELTSFWLLQSQVSGTIPPQIGNLSNLNTLVLSCPFSGSIPAEIGNLTNLTTLAISETPLSGSIPEVLWSLQNLTYLDLSSNQLSGSIPSDIQNLWLLDDLLLDNNQFSGLIPEGLGQLPLSEIDLSNNDFSGCYPSNLSNLCGSNVTLDFSGNPNLPNGGDFSTFCNTGYGECGTDYCAISDSLALVALYNSTNGTNWTNTWNLNQPMDTWHGVTLNSDRCVREIELDGNNLTGILPIEIGNFKNIEELWLNNNQVTGSIPLEIGNLETLQVLYLEQNQLTGSIPESIGNLTELLYFWALLNNLTGEIPSSIGNLNKLNDLFLNNNSFTGVIPIQIGNLQNIKRLYLSHNFLTGNIPKELGNVTSVEELYIRDNQLSGTVPVEMSNLNNLIYFHAQNNNLSGCFHPSLTNLCINTNAFSGNPNLPNFNDFCNNGTDACTPDMVWPGDFDHNGIAQPDDALYWGLTQGNTGPSRPNAATNWTGQNAPNWSGTVFGVNNKYQDGDGNGIINSNDLTVLENNLGSTHRLLPSNPIDNGIEFQLDLVGFTPSGNKLYDVYIRQAGSAPLVHGIAGTINFRNSADVVIDFSNSSLTPQETIYKYENGQLDFALTRTDLTDKRCINPIFRLELEIIIEDELPLGGGGDMALSQGATSSASGFVNATKTSNFFGVYNPQFLPNGIFDISLDVIHEGCNTMGEASIEVSNGFPPYTYQWSSGDTGITASNLTAGLYSVTVSDGQSTQSVDFEVLPFTITYDNNGNPTNCAPLSCFPSLGVSDNISTNTYQAINALSANGYISNGENVIFKSGGDINLNPGFSVEQGAILTLEQDDCSSQ